MIEILFAPTIVCTPNKKLGSCMGILFNVARPSAGLGLLFPRQNISTPHAGPIFLFCNLIGSILGLFCKDYLPVKLFHRRLNNSSLQGHVHKYGVFKKIFFPQEELLGPSLYFSSLSPPPPPPSKVSLRQRSSNPSLLTAARILARE